jgi:hypothetical protein
VSTLSALTPPGCAIGPAAMSAIGESGDFDPKLPLRPSSKGLPKSASARIIVPRIAKHAVLSVSVLRGFRFLAPRLNKTRGETRSYEIGVDFERKKHIRMSVWNPQNAGGSVNVL